jgi:molecular chaperone DnaK
MPVVGIDLGTTYSLVGTVNDEGLPTLFPDARQAGQYRTPSVVIAGEGSALTGDAAEQWLVEQPESPVARFFKLHMGKPDTVYTDRSGDAWRPEALSALVLRKVARDAEVASAGRIDLAVVTVPAQFGDAARRATKHAALLAGLPDPPLLEEPVAAALFYGFSEASTERTLFVYDLGGGTFDATLLHATSDGVYTLATDGASDIGGKNFDELIMKTAAAEFLREYRWDPLEEPVAREELRRFATRTKIQLGTEPLVRRTLMLAGRTVTLVLARAHFEQQLRPLVERSIRVCQRALESAGLDWSAVDGLLFTGGSTLVPSVRSLVGRATGLPEDRMLLRQPHQAVAYGAALHARKLTTGRDSVLQRVATADLGIRVADPVRRGVHTLHTLIRRNTPLPARVSATFYTTRDDQTRMVFDIAQQKGSEEPIESLGHFVFGPISHPRRNYPIELELAYDIEGLVTVTARDPVRDIRLERVLDDRSQGGAEDLTAMRAQVMRAG